MREGRRARRRRRHGRRGWAALACAAVVGCATGGRAPAGPPLSDPAAAAAEARRASVPDRPHRVRLSWDYTDPRGPVSGDGVLRYNPPDSIRLDLFAPGDASMSVALAGDGLRSVGQIEDVRLPPPPFLYASAGLFRPGASSPARGYRSDGDRVLLYGIRAGDTLSFRLRDGRVRRVEERRDGRLVREVELTWTGEGAWPASAEYRDRERESRARWEMEEARPEGEPFPREIFDLPRSP